MTAVKEDLAKEVERLLETYRVPRHSVGYIVAREVIIIMYDSPDMKLNDVIKAAAEGLGFTYRSAYYSVTACVKDAHVPGYPDKLTPKKFFRLCANQISRCHMED